MPTEVSHCQFCVIKNTDFDKQLEWYCKKGHKLIHTDGQGQLVFECLRPTKEITCPDYKKGIAYTWDEMKIKLGLKDKNE
jgi:hypothetical protein